jgi:urea transport system substrate-binding protein
MKSNGEDKLRESQHVTYGVNSSESLSTRKVDADVTAAPRAKQDPSDWLGQTLGKYKITGFLGEGGMGMVMKGLDSSIDRTVAIKLLPPDLGENDNALQRFKVEARSAAKSNHPNIVTIYEIGEDKSTHYLAMEFISGGSVADALKSRGRYEVAEATRIITEACLGLASAHRRGLVHRDIKPANLLLTDDGSVKVSDFGLAKPTDDDALSMTKTGQILGTPSFMSPEQCQSAKVDSTSDVYSLGATYYSLLTGKVPYHERGSIVQVMFAHCNDEPPNPSVHRDDLPESCLRIISRAMAKDSKDRYASMDEMKVDLQKLQHELADDSPSTNASQHTTPNRRAADATSPHPQKKTPVKLLAASAAALLFFVAALIWWSSGNSGVNNNSVNNAGTSGGGGDPTAAANPTIGPPVFIGEPIRVGVLHSLTGTMAQSESPVVDALLLAINQTNQAGGLLGRRIEPIILDGKSDWPTFAAQAGKLLLEDKVSTVFGCWTSASRKTVVPIFEEHNNLLIYPVQYEGIEESPNIVYTGAAPNQQILPAVKWAFETQNARRFFFIGSDYVFPRVASEIITDQVQELGGEITGQVFFPLEATDFNSVIAQIETAKPDVILSCINGASNTAFFNQLRNNKKLDEIETISFSIGEEELRFMNTDRMTNDFAAWSYFQSIDLPMNNQLLADFHEKYGPQRVFTDPMAAAYFGFKLWAQAVEEAQSDNPIAIRRAMLNQRIDAAAGPLRIDATTQHTYQTPRIGKVQPDGQFEIVWMADAPVRPQPYPPSRSTSDWRAMLHDLYSGWGKQWSAPSE